LSIEQSGSLSGEYDHQNVGRDNQSIESDLLGKGSTTEDQLKYIVFRLSVTSV